MISSNMCETKYTKLVIDTEMAIKVPVMNKIV